MRDVPPLSAPCPNTKGRHDFNAVIPGEDTGDVTLWCSFCGAMRRVPANGSLFAGTPLDDWPANDVRVIAEEARQ